MKPVVFNKLTSRFRQFGGFRLVLQYAKLNVLPVVVKELFRCLIKRQSFKTVYIEVIKLIEPMLIAKYGSKIREFKKFNSSRKLEQ